MKFCMLFVSLIVLSLAAYAQTSADFSGANGGAVVVGYDSRTCDGTIEGAVRYNSAQSAIQVCTSVSWVTWGE